MMDVDDRFPSSRAIFFYVFQYNQVLQLSKFTGFIWRISCFVIVGKCFLHKVLVNKVLNLFAQKREPPVLFAKSIKGRSL